MDNDLKKTLKRHLEQVPELPRDFGEHTAERIRTQGIRMRPRALFVAQKWGLRVGLAGSLTLSALGFNAFWFEAKQSSALEFLSFGSSTLPTVLRALPYDLLLWALVFLAAAELAVMRMDLIARYSRPALLSLAVLVLATGGTGTALALSTPVNESLQRNIVDSGMDMPVVSRFYRERARYSPPDHNCLMGRVHAVEPATLVVLTPNGHVIRVTMNEDVQYPEALQPDLRSGDIITAVGQGRDQGFLPSKLRRSEHADSNRFFPVLQSVER